MRARTRFRPHPLLLGLALAVLAVAVPLRRGSADTGATVPFQDIRTPLDRASLPELTTPWDNRPLGGRTAVILIHGWHSDQTVWAPVYDALHSTYVDVGARVKVYCFSYDHDQHIDFNAGWLASEVAKYSGKGGELENARFVVIGHSTGGLVARGWIERYDGASRLIRLITLGTPHHGTPWADPLWVGSLLGPEISVLEALAAGFSGLFRYDIGSGSVQAFSDGSRDLIPDGQDGLPAIGLATAGGYARVLNAQMPQKPDAALRAKYVCYAGWLPEPYQLTTDWQSLAAWAMGAVLGYPQYAPNDYTVPLTSALFLDPLRYSQDPVSTATQRAFSLQVGEPDGSKLAADSQTRRMRTFAGVIHTDLPRDPGVIDFLMLDMLPIVHAGITYTADGAQPRTLHFDAMAPGDPSSSDFGTLTSFQWDFGDGSAPEPGPQATHQFRQSGWYKVTLAVTDSLGLTGTSSTQVAALDQPGQTGGPTYVSGSLEGNFRWYRSLGPYVIQRNLTVPSGSSLSIEPGTVVKFALGCELRIYGTLVADGENDPSLHITFTSLNDDSSGGDTNGDGTTTVAAPADWSGIYGTGSAARLAFNYCDIRYGQELVGTSGAASLTVTNSRLSNAGDGAFAGGWGVVASLTSSVGISGCTFASNQTGLALDGATGPSVTGCTFESNELGLELFQNTDATIASNTFRDNALAGILDGVLTRCVVRRNTASGTGEKGLECSYATFIGDTVLEGNPGLPYVFASVNSDGVSHVPAGSSLTFGPGAVVKLGGSPLSSGFITIQGSLAAQGTAESPVVFTSLNDDTVEGDTNGDGGGTKPAPGDWNCLRVKGASGSATLTYCQVRYGGESGGEGMVEALGASSLTLTNSRFEHAGGFGGRAVSVDRTPAAQIAGCTFASNRVSLGEGLLLYGTASASVSGCVFDGNNTGVEIDQSTDPSITGNTFSNNGLAGIVEAVTQPTIRGNAGLGTGMKAFECSDALFTGDTTLDANSNLPYTFSRTRRDVVIPAQSTLTLAPGVVIKSIGYIGCQGTLAAQGTPDKPIVFTPDYSRGA